MPGPSMTCGSVTYSERCDFRCGGHFQTWKRLQRRSALPRKTDIGYQSARLSEINSSISAPFRSTIDNAIMTSPGATSTG
jgi:hypothetical protein